MAVTQRDCKSGLFPVRTVPDSKVHMAHIGPTWVLSAPGGPYVGPMNLAITGVRMLLMLEHTASIG